MANEFLKELVRGIEEWADAVSATEKEMIDACRSVFCGAYVPWNGIDYGVRRQNGYQLNCVRVIYPETTLFVRFWEN